MRAKRPANNRRLEAHQELVSDRKEIPRKKPPSALGCKGFVYKAYCMGNRLK
jgi:hypothetical protein